MPKIELENIRLSISPITEQCYAGIISKDGASWMHKKNVHNDFLDAVIACWGGKTQTVENGDGYKYEITVKKIKL